jgi:hypothetical protein
VRRLFRRLSSLEVIIPLITVGYIVHGLVFAQSPAPAFYDSNNNAIGRAIVELVPLEQCDNCRCLKEMVSFILEGKGYGYGYGYGYRGYGYGYGWFRRYLGYGYGDRGYGYGYAYEPLSSTDVRSTLLRVEKRIRAIEELSETVEKLKCINRTELRRVMEALEPREDGYGYGYGYREGQRLRSQQQRFTHP